VPRFIVEADGGSRGNPGPASYGAVVRDAETGQVLAERAEYIGIETNNVAEYRGLIAGLTAAREIDPDATVEARLDSKLVVEQLSGRWKVKHPSMRPLAVRARDILPVEQVTYTWVPRELNKHADRLANEALDAQARGETWSESTSGAALSVGSSTKHIVDEAEDDPPPSNSIVGWDQDLGSPTTTLLLRHGETEHTIGRLFSGSGGADPPLATTGLAQAAAAAAALTGRGITAIVSSPMRRARQTADAAASAVGLPVREIDELRECDFGEWEGHTFAEVRERWPQELAGWLGSTSVAAPGGESLDAVDRRVRRARDKVLARHSEGTVLVVCHVNPIKALVRVALGAPATALYRMELSPASLSRIEWYANGTASLRSFNEVFS
jgi:ribonuclease H / adenosylcobalamin/alpha-ribazole phosphatase